MPAGSMAQRRDGLSLAFCLGAARAEKRYDMSQPLAMEGLGRMSRMEPLLNSQRNPTQPLRCRFQLQWLIGVLEI